MCLVDVCWVYLPYSYMYGDGSRILEWGEMNKLIKEKGAGEVPSHPARGSRGVL